MHVYPPCISCVLNRPYVCYPQAGDGGNDHDVIVAVICGPVAAVLVLSVLVLWYLKLGCFNTASSSELEFVIKTPDDWLTGHNPSSRESLQTWTTGSTGGSSSRVQSDAVAELSFWQVAQSKSATMIGLVMRRGSKSMRTSLVSRLDGPIASMRDFVNSPQVVNPPPSSSMWEVRASPCCLLPTRWYNSVVVCLGNR